MTPIDQITQKSIGKTILGWTSARECHIYPTHKGNIPVSFLKDKNGNNSSTLQYIDGDYDLQAKQLRPFKGVFVQPLGWSICSAEAFLSRFCEPNTHIRYVEHIVQQKPGEKISKPQELKNISQSFSLPHIFGKKGVKATVQVFLKDNDVWLKINDYFSPSMQVPLEEVGTPLSYRAEKCLGKSVKKKFIYDDNWGDIVLQRKAWVKLENIISFINNEDNEQVSCVNAIEACRSFLKEDESFLATSFARMIERLVGRLYQKGPSTNLISFGS